MNPPPEKTRLVVFCFGVAEFSERRELTARSPSGKAKVCKTFIGGSSPPRASNSFDPFRQFRKERYSPRGGFLMRGSRAVYASCATVLAVAIVSRALAYGYPQTTKTTSENR